MGALDARPRWTRDTESRSCRQCAKVAAAPSRCVPYVRSTVPARGLAPPRLDPHHLIPSHRRPRAYPSRLSPLPVPSVIKTGVISQAAGSAYVEFDKTKVMCGVYGPRQGGKIGGATNDRGRVEVDVKLATFATPGARGKTGQGDAEREFSSLVLRALEGAIIAETFPKTSVDVYATVIEAGGAELSATVAAASAALAQAGVAMRDLVSACSVSRVTEGGAEGNDEGLSTLLLDPTAAEEEAADGAVTIAHMSTGGEATQIVVTGEWEVDALDEAMQLAASGCARVDQALREVLRQGAEEAATLAGV